VGQYEGTEGGKDGNEDNVECEDDDLVVTVPEGDEEGDEDKVNCQNDKSNSINEVVSVTDGETKRQQTNQDAKKCEGCNDGDEDNVEFENDESCSNDVVAAVTEGIGDGNEDNIELGSDKSCSNDVVVAFPQGEMISHQTNQEYEGSEGINDGDEDIVEFVNDGSSSERDVVAVTEGGTTPQQTNQDKMKYPDAIKDNKSLIVGLMKMYGVDNENYSNNDVNKSFGDIDCNNKTRKGFKGCFNEKSNLNLNAGKIEDIPKEDDSAHLDLGDINISPVKSCNSGRDKQEIASISTKCEMPNNHKGGSKLVSHLGNDVDSRSIESDFESCEDSGIDFKDEEFFDSNSATLLDGGIHNFSKSLLQDDHILKGKGTKEGNPKKDEIDVQGNLSLNETVDTTEYLEKNLINYIGQAMTNLSLTFTEADLSEGETVGNKLDNNT